MMATPVSEGLHAQLTRATHDLVSYNKLDNPRIDVEQQSRAVDVATSIGRLDAESPGCDQDSPRKRLPSEEHIMRAGLGTLEAMGAKVDHAISRSRRGQLLEVEHEADKSASLHVMAFLRRHGLTLIALVPVAILEFIVGKAWTQRVFDLSEDASFVAAAALPLIFALIGYAGAHACMQWRRGRVRSWVGAGFLFTALLGATAIVLAALVIGEIVTRPAAGGSGISGGGLPGTAGAASESGLSAFNWVVAGAYVSLMLALSLLIFVMHLTELYREEVARVHAAAAAAEGALDDAAIAHSNLAYLEQYIDVFEQLEHLHNERITAYIAGTRAVLDSSIADDWNSDRLLEDRQEPAWVNDLREEISRLEDVGGQAAPRTAALHPVSS